MSDVIVVPPTPGTPGVKPEVAEKIAHALEKKGVRYFGSAGASLTHQAFNPEKSSEIKPALALVGLEGERYTSDLVRKWMEDKPNLVLVDSVHINMSYKDSRSLTLSGDDMGELEEIEKEREGIDPDTGIIDGKDTDHVLIAGTDVLLIDTKRWKSGCYYTLNESGQVLRNRKSFPGGRLRMRQSIYLWRDYLIGEASVNGMVHINTDEEEPNKREVIRDRQWYRQNFQLVEKGRLYSSLDEWYNEIVHPFNRVSINSSIVSQVALSAIKPFDPYEKVFNMDTLRKFQNKES